MADEAKPNPAGRAVMPYRIRNHHSGGRSATGISAARRIHAQSIRSIHAPVACVRSATDSSRTAPARDRGQPGLGAHFRPSLVRQVHLPRKPSLAGQDVHGSEKALQAVERFVAFDCREPLAPLCSRIVPTARYGGDSVRHISDRANVESSLLK